MDVDLSNENQSGRLIPIFVSRLKDVAGEKFSAEALSNDLKKAGVDITGQGLRNLREGKWLPKVDILYGLAKYFNKPMEWFLGGEEPKPVQIVHPPELMIETVPRFKTFEKTFAPESYIPIRLLSGKAAAGPPSQVDEQEIKSWVLIYADKRWMPNDPENYTCCEVYGYSMHPILSDGDIVAIDHAQRDPHELDKKMAAFRINGGITIKWLKYFPEKALVVGVPENKDDFDNVVTLKEDEINTGIVGKVAWWWAKR